MVQSAGHYFVMGDHRNDSLYSRAFGQSRRSTLQARFRCGGDRWMTGACSSGDMMSAGALVQTRPRRRVGPPTRQRTGRESRPATGRDWRPRSCHVVLRVDQLQSTAHGSEDCHVHTCTSLGLHCALDPVCGPRQAGARPDAATPALVGRWDLTVHGSGGDYPSWLEVWTSGTSHLVGQFVGRGGSARPISHIEFTNGTMRFSIPPQWDKRPDDETYEATLKGEKLEGWTTDRAGKRIAWSGVRAPSLARTGTPTWGKPVKLIAASSLAGWREPNKGWKVASGVLSSVGAADNLVSTPTFGDFKLHVEFRLPKGSNSGVYLRGRYKVQIEDSDAAEPPLDHMGGSTDSSRLPGIRAGSRPMADVRRHPGRPHRHRRDERHARHLRAGDSRHHRRCARSRRGLARSADAAGRPRRDEFRNILVSPAR